MIPTLSYPTKPPGDRVEAIWQGDAVDITLPPRLTARMFITLVVLAAAAIISCAAALESTGTARFAGGSIGFGNGVFARVTAGIVAVVATLGLVSVIRQARTWTRLSAHGGVLTCTLPSLLGMRVRQLPFDQAVDVTIGQPEDHGGEWHLLLHRRNGLPESLLENTVYRVADLQRVAEVLREAIKRSHQAAVPAVESM